MNGLHFHIEQLEDGRWTWSLVLLAGGTPVAVCPEPHVERREAEHQMNLVSMLAANAPVPEAPRPKTLPRLKVRFA